MIFANLIYRHFDFWMSQYGQVKKVVAFRTVLFEYVCYSRFNCNTVGVCWGMLSYVDIFEFPGYVWGPPGRCLWVSEWYSWKLEVLRCV